MLAGEAQALKPGTAVRLNEDAPEWTLDKVFFVEEHKPGYVLCFTPGGVQGSKSIVRVPPGQIAKVITGLFAPREEESPVVHRTLGSRTKVAICQCTHANYRHAGGKGNCDVCQCPEFVEGKRCGICKDLVEDCACDDNSGHPIPCPCLGCAPLRRL